MSDKRTTQVLQRFNQAFLSHDPTLLEELIAEECVVEAPNGERFTGHDACLEFWAKMAAGETKYEPEDLWVSGGRGVIRWRSRTGRSDEDTVRGVYLMRLRDGRIVEGLGYVKSA